MRKKNFPINGVNRLTDIILDKCINPNTLGEWDRRGMVVGHVQSGKTSNYIGLINKAIDSGYKMIIVLAGMLGSLRLQTQSRIDKGVIGRDSSDFIENKRTNIVGVGKYSVKKQVFSYTSDKSKNGKDIGDFNSAIATRLNVPINGSNPTVLVVKKNYRILENLILWLSSSAGENEEGYPLIKNVPLLLIDDEADHASVNSAKPDEDIKRINRDIRALLNLFEQKSFVGYTATPYANLFILEDYDEDEDFSIRTKRFKIGPDLFPRHFIINLHPPSNYIGARKVFGFENELTGESVEPFDLIRAIQFSGHPDDNYEPEPHIPRKITYRLNNREALPQEIPESLKLAIKQFILVCAIRRVRGQITEHNSMLVHVARFVLWVDRIAVLIDRELNNYKNFIRNSDVSFLSELKTLFINDFLPTTLSVKAAMTKYYDDDSIKVHTWSEVVSELFNATEKIVVRSVIGSSRRNELEFHPIEELNYETRDKNGFSVIAVGGTKLSRGLTLEGLSVSYFLRASKMYDSLMQMGRWFGYRPGYVDLCRLNTTTQLRDWYEHITVATEDMRSDFDDLVTIPGRTPADYPLKVRTHLGQLNITSRNRIFGRFEKEWHGYSGKVVQTSVFHTSDKIITHNYSLVQRLFDRINIKPQYFLKKDRLNRLLFSGDFGKLVGQFLREYRGNISIKGEILESYINRQLDNGNLTNWSILLFSNTQNEKIITSLRIDGKNPRLGLTNRSNKNAVDDSEYRLSRHNIQQKADKIFDLQLVDDSINGKSTSREIKAARTRHQKCLLILYLLDFNYEPSKEDTFEPLVGFYLEFPRIQNEALIEYAVRPFQNDFDDLGGETDEDEEDS